MVWKRPKTQGLEGLEKATKPPKFGGLEGQKAKFGGLGGLEKAKSQILRLGGSGKGQKAKFGAWRGGGKGQKAKLGGLEGVLENAKKPNLGAWAGCAWSGMGCGLWGMDIGLEWGGITFNENSKLMKMQFKAKFTQFLFILLLRVLGLGFRV